MFNSLIIVHATGKSMRVAGNRMGVADYKIGQLRKANSKQSNLIEVQVSLSPNMEADRQADRQTERQADRQTDRPTDPTTVTLTVHTH